MLSLCCYLHRWSLLPSINVCLACAQQSNCTLCYCIEVGGCCIALFCFFCVSFLSCLFVHPWIVLCCSQTILREWGWAFFALSLLLRTLSHFCHLSVHPVYRLVFCLQFCQSSACYVSGLSSWSLSPLFSKGCSFCFLPVLTVPCLHQIVAFLPVHFLPICLLFSKGCPYFRTSQFFQSIACICYWHFFLANIITVQQR